MQRRRVRQLGDDPIRDSRRPASARPRLACTGTLEDQQWKSLGIRRTCSVAPACSAARMSRVPRNPGPHSGHSESASPSARPGRNSRTFVPFTAHEEAFSCCTWPDSVCSGNRAMQLARGHALPSHFSGWQPALPAAVAAAAPQRSAAWRGGPGMLRGVCWGMQPMLSSGGRRAPLKEWPQKKWTAGSSRGAPDRAQRDAWNTRACAQGFTGGHSEYM